MQKAVQSKVTNLSFKAVSVFLRLLFRPFGIYTNRAYENAVRFVVDIVPEILAADNFAFYPVEIGKRQYVGHPVHAPIFSVERLYFFGRNEIEFYRELVRLSEFFIHRVCDFIEFVRFFVLSYYDKLSHKSPFAYSELGVFHSVVINTRKRVGYRFSYDIDIRHRKVALVKLP